MFAFISPKLTTMMSRIGTRVSRPECVVAPLLRQPNEGQISGSPRIYAREERFSAREEVSTLIARYSAGNAFEFSRNRAHNGGGFS
jgi:hypothetical protein